MTVPVLDAVEKTRIALEDNISSHWIIGFSGGKDSTALLKIFYAAAKRTGRLPNKIDIIYCDTGVENTILDQYVKSLFNRLQKEFQEKDSIFNVKILRAPVPDRFFVKIIGRGYPPPTNSFRWCTKNLRISPVSKFIAEAAKQDAVVSLGIRRSESQQRDRSIEKNGNEYWQYQNEGGRKYRVFLPILDLSVSDVWDTIFLFGQPSSIIPEKLEQLYRDASGECPIIKTPQSAPCSSGRFGCWTCTVVRKDHSAQKLIEAGHEELRPYLEFRNWLNEIRNDPNRRWENRRNGVNRAGPFTLKARREILLELIKLENKTSSKIIDNEEMEEIFRLWNLDKSIDKTIKIKSTILKIKSEHLSL